MDVAILLHSNGMVLKSASYSGTVMTKCLIRENFFLDQSYEIVQKPKHDKNDPIFDFCIPAKELKDIIDSISDIRTTLELYYPV